MYSLCPYLHLLSKMDSIFTKNTLLYVALFTPSVYFWKKVYETYLSLEEEARQDELFQKRHDCVVTYARKRMNGWPPHVEGVKWDRNGTKFSEPIYYFINTAKYSLDIAIMSIKITGIFEALKAAKLRGVKVRLIINFVSSKDQRVAFNDLFDSGIPVQFFVSKEQNMTNIMHHKYMVKDYGKDRGFVAMGSLNLNYSSVFYTNFESVAFTTNQDVVQAFYDNFQECWNELIEDNKNIFNRTVLSSASFKF